EACMYDEVERETPAMDALNDSMWHRMNPDTGITRRSLLKRSMVLGLSVPAIATLLSACGDDDEEPTATDAEEEAEAPTATEEEEEAEAPTATEEEEEDDDDDEEEPTATFEPEP